MSTPSSSPATALAQVQDLESRFATAMQELYVVGNGLAQVRFTLDQSARRTTLAPEGAAEGAAPAAASTATAATAATAGAATTDSAATSAAVTSAAPVDTVPTLPAQPRWWERPGAVAKVLGAVGAIVTLVGVALLLAIAVAAGIFGPLPRVVSGALLAAGLLGAGIRLRRRSPGSVGAEALAATGLAAAYLDVLAATALYDFIPGAPGLVIAALLAVGTFVLARSWDSQLLAVLAAAPPALLAPAITGAESLTTMSFVALLLVGSAFAHLDRPWPYLYLARILPAGLVLLITVLALGATPPVLTVVTATALGMLAAGTIESARHLQYAATLAALGAALPMLLAVTMLESSRLPVAAALTALFLVVAAFLNSDPATHHVSTGEATEQPAGEAMAERTLWIAALLTGSVLLVIAAVSLPTPSDGGLSLALAAAAYLVVAVWRRSQPVAAMAVILAGLSALIFTPQVFATVSATSLARLATPMSIVHGVALTGFAALTLVLARSIGEPQRRAQVTRAAGVLAFICGSAVVVSLGTWVGLSSDEERLGFFGGHAAATALWTALAAMLVTVVARRARDRTIYVRLGLALVAAAVAKLFLFDLSALSGLIRVVAFVITGLIVLAIGVAYSKVDDRPDPALPEQPLAGRASAEDPGAV